MAEEAHLGVAHLRLDKWLWFARFFKSRSLAATLCQSGKIRLAGNAVRKASQQIKAGDVLTFAQERDIRVIKIVALGTRRGPASEAQGLYEDLSPPQLESRLPFEKPQAMRASGEGRPTKRDRRQIDRLKDFPDRG